jgi:hypothetical protein
MWLMADSTVVGQLENLSFVDVCKKAGRKSGFFVSYAFPGNATRHLQ